MAPRDPWYKRYGLIILGTLLVFSLGALVNTENQADSASYQLVAQPVNEPTDSAAQDQLNSETVNQDRLHKIAESRQNQTVDTTQLESQINTIINSNPDIIFGISIKDLNTGTTYNYGDEQAMTAASVAKLITATYYLHEVEAGNKKLETMMANGYSAQECIEQMIVVSDNNCWHDLNDYLGYQNMQNYAHSIGLTSYYYPDNLVSAPDITKLDADLYDRKLVNEAHSELLLSYMERANYRDLVIPAVPETDTVYHKAGEYAGHLHDATIITNGNKTIVLTIFTQSTYSYSKSRVASLMQQITIPALETFGLN